MTARATVRIPERAAICPPHLGAWLSNRTSDQTGWQKKITANNRYTGATDYEIPPGETGQLVSPPDYIINSLSYRRVISVSWKSPGGHHSSYAALWLLPPSALR